MIHTPHMKPSPSPEVTCSTCKGAGVVPLSGALLETYAMLRKLRWATAARMRKHLPNVNHAAMCNRLAELYRLGVAGREGSRYSWTYFIKNNHQTK